MANDRNFAKPRDLPNPLEGKEIEITDTNVQEQLEEVVISTGTIEGKKAVTMDDVVVEVMEELVYKRHLKPKATDNEVKTTIYLKRSVYDKLNEPRYRIQGMKKIIVNKALEAFFKSGKADELIDNYNKIIKERNNAEKRAFKSFTKNYGNDNE